MQLEFTVDESVPGIRREIYVVRKANGAVEAWRESSVQHEVSPADEYIGGVQIHYAADPGDGSAAASEYCGVLGGRCWHDGSSRAFEEIRYHFGSPNPDHVHRFLNSWAETYLQPRSSHPSIGLSSDTRRISRVVHAGTIAAFRGRVALSDQELRRRSVPDRIVKALDAGPVEMGRADIEVLADALDVDAR